MKIVVAGTRGIPNVQGGVETHCEELYPRLVKLGCEITVVRRSCYVASNNKIKSYKGVKLKDIYAPRQKYIEALLHTFLAVLYAKKTKADILHIHAVGPALLTPFARLLGLKVVFTHHGHDYDREKWGKFAKLILKLGERTGCRFANGVIVISDMINNNVKRLYNCNDAHLIYNGVSAPNFINDTSYLDELGVEPGGYIFAMGRFVPEKNFHRLINSFSALNRHDCKLVLAGDADHEDDYSHFLKQQAKKNGIILTGFIKGEKLHALLTHARFFVLPSSHEGLPISLLEAMNYRLPILASDIPANLEVGLPAENYFKVGNEKELTIRLQEYINTSFQKINYQMDKYQWNKVAEQTMEIYKKIVLKSIVNPINLFL